MAFKMKGSPMHRNYGIGSPAKQAAKPGKEPNYTGGELSEVKVTDTYQREPGKELPEVEIKKPEKKKDEKKDEKKDKSKTALERLSRRKERKEKREKYINKTKEIINLLDKDTI